MAGKMNDWKKRLMSEKEAAALMRLFKVFANDTRLRLLHALVQHGELCVGELAEAIGMKPQAVSNQLQRLVDRGILAAQRRASHVYYRIADPCVPILLERGLCLLACHPEGPPAQRPSGNQRQKRLLTGVRGSTHPRTGVRGSAITR